MLSGAASRPSAASQSERADHGVEQPGQGQAGQEGRDRPGQEHHRLDQAPALERAPQQQRQPQAEQELQRHRADRPPRRIHERAIEDPIARQGLEVGQAHPAGLERIEDLDVLEGVGEPDDQGHEQHQPDQDERRAQIEVGLESELREGRPRACPVTAPHLLVNAKHMRSFCRE